MVLRENPGVGARGVFKYDPINNRWSVSASSLVGRWFCLSGVVDGKLYIGGGLGSNNNLALIGSVEQYSLEEDKWTNVRFKLYNQE